MIYRGIVFIPANSPSPQTPNSRPKGGRARPRPRLLIFYASHSMTLVREGPAVFSISLNASKDVEEK